MGVVVVTGASGFIGNHLLKALAERKDTLVRALERSGRKHCISIGERFTAINGDLLDKNSLEKLILPSCTVVNLAYLPNCSRDENLAALSNLIKICAQKGIKRFIHCSTAVVVGNVSNKEVNERTTCVPYNEYEKLKLDLENLLLEKSRGLFEVVILRPTAVLGPGGCNLLKLVEDLKKSRTFVNYLKSCLFNSRKMNLVPVANVVAAIIFLVDYKKDFDREIFIISEDESPINNYRDIERILIERLRYKKYFLPVVPLPAFVLAGALKLFGRSCSNPARIYSCRKIMNLGFHKPVSLESALTFFVQWYQGKESQRSEIEG